MSLELFVANGDIGLPSNLTTITAPSSGLGSAGLRWEDPVIGGLQGLNQWFGQLNPYLLPILLILFIGGLMVFLAKKVVVTVS